MNDPTGVLTDAQVIAQERSYLGLEPGQATSALCLSGGGMRSASFCIGFLRGFRELLTQFDYLSTVSGGGYAGTWLSTLLRDPAKRATLQTIFDQKRNSDEIWHLRRSSDLLETRSWFSTAAVRLVSSYLRSLTIWWLLFIPLIVALAFVPWILAFVERGLEFSMVGQTLAAIALVGLGGVSIVRLEHLLCSRRSHSGVLRGPVEVVIAGALLLASIVEGGWRMSFRVWAGPLVPEFVPNLVFWLTMSVLIAAASVPIHYTWGHGKRRPVRFTVVGLLSLSFCWALAGLVRQLLPASLPQVLPVTLPLIAAGAWLAGAIVVGAHGWRFSDMDRERASEMTGTVGTIGLIAIAASALTLATHWILATLSGQLQPIIGGATLGGLITAYLGFRSRIGQRTPRDWRKYFAYLAVLVAVLFGLALWLLASWFWIAVAPDLPRVLIQSFPTFGVLWTPLGIFIVLFGFALLWSRKVGANAFSLNGLYRVRLVRAFASATRRPSKKPIPRRPRPDLTLGPKSKTVIRPLHLVNAVVNDASVRDRQAESFTLSILHCGSKVTGYCATSTYGRALTMGRAMAISGAAANPSMGYFSSRPVSWLMGFFNLRLGWWLGNPRFQTKRGQAEPPWALTPYLEELLGTSGGDSEYINLSDGGHFENLGLYEAIRRECRYIVAVDASHDPDGKHFDLARVERLIRLILVSSSSGRRPRRSATTEWLTSSIRRGSLGIWSTCRPN
jgi:hypothetical protein